MTNDSWAAVMAMAAALSAHERNKSAAGWKQGLLANPEDSFKQMGFLSVRLLIRQSINVAGRFSHGLSWTIDAGWRPRGHHDWIKVTKS